MVERYIGEYVDIPTLSQPITSPTQTTTKKSAIPVIAGLSAAAVAGIGTKAYLDKKEENDEEDDELTTEEWEGDESTDFNYGDDIYGEDSDYLTPADEYAFQEDAIESYEATNSSELPSMN